MYHGTEFVPTVHRRSVLVNQRMDAATLLSFTTVAARRLRGTFPLRSVFAPLCGFRGWIVNNLREGDVLPDALDLDGRLVAGTRSGNDQDVAALDLGDAVALIA